MIFVHDNRSNNIGMQSITHFWMIIYNYYDKKPELLYANFALNPKIIYFNYGNFWAILKGQHLQVWYQPSWYFLSASTDDVCVILHTIRAGIDNSSLKIITHNISEILESLRRQCWSNVWGIRDTHTLISPASVHTCPC